MYADRKEWDVGDLEVDVDYELAPRRASRFDVTMQLPGDAHRRAGGADSCAIAGKCPVHRTLLGDVEIADRGGAGLMAEFETRLLIGGEQVAGDGRAARGREPVHRGDARDGRAAASRRADRRRDRRGARGGARLGRDARASSAARCCTRSRARLRARTDELARVDDARGRQAADRELRRGRLDGGRVRLLRGDRPQQRRPRDPADRVDASSRWC